eukprot:3198899-Rhodomonas_salina.1
MADDENLLNMPPPPPQPTELEASSPVSESSVSASSQASDSHSHSDGGPTPDNSIGKAAKQRQAKRSREHVLENTESPVM